MPGGVAGQHAAKGVRAEATLNVTIGVMMAFAGRWLMFPMVGLVASPRQHLDLTLGFTALSLLRSYALRRLFNAKGARGTE